MAAVGVVLDKDQFNCSICLDILKNPVTIPCGHSYCLDCIQYYWDQNDFLGVFACPQCRQTFSPRPPLARNTVLSNVVEKFLKTELQEAATGSNQNFIEAEDVECDVCTRNKNKAVKSCLVCMASYCKLHVQPHFESPAFKKHKLAPASRFLQERICGRHNRLLDLYCRTDKQYVCYLCLTDEHEGHDTVVAEKEIQQKQREIGDLKQWSQTRIHQRETEAQELRQAILSLMRSARVTAEGSDALFSELIRSIELKRFEVRELIKAQEKMAVNQAEQLLEKIQKEITELKTNEAELDKLATTDDNFHFLQNCQSLQAPPVLSALPSFNSESLHGHLLTFDPVMTALSNLKGLLQTVCQEGFVSVYERVRDVVIINPAVQLHTTQSGDNHAAGQTEAALVIPPHGLDQNPAITLNPFLITGPAVPTFGFTLGSKWSSASRQKHPPRRAHPRKK